MARDNKKAAPAQNNTFRVIMIGQRRAGKSSMLSSMIDQMDAVKATTRVHFKADPDTQALMNKKKTMLKEIFKAYDRHEKFDTLEGFKGQIEYGLSSNETNRYVFNMELKNEDFTSNLRSYRIEFQDIRGEDMVGGDRKLSEDISKSSVIMVAVDTPALMEEDGAFNESVNIPSLVFHRIAGADMLLEDEPEASKFPKLILMVPIKCEKYYYNSKEGGSPDLNAVNEAIRNQYKLLFQYVDKNPQYSLAITPILTLGDVVFQNYQVCTEEDDKVTYHPYQGASEELLQEGYCRQMYGFRRAEDPSYQPAFKPMYCEQPLIYLLNYIIALSHTAVWEKATGDGKKTQAETAPPTGKKKVAKTAKTVGKVALITAGAIFAPVVTAAYFITKGVAGAYTMSRDQQLLQAIMPVRKHLKTSGDGYKVIYDRLKLEGGISN